MDRSTQANGSGEGLGNLGTMGAHCSSVGQSDHLAGFGPSRRVWIGRDHVLYRQLHPNYPKEAL